MNPKILLVEDDTMIASGLIYALEQESYTVTHCRSVSDALRAMTTTQFSLAILDMQLPDGTGNEVHKSLQGTNTAVIFLTVVDDEGNIVSAFESGAADYITKPFRVRELLARVRRALNTSGGGNNANLTLGGVVIDISAGKVYLDGELLDLTALEYRLLMTFASNKGQLLTRGQILENIWDSSGSFVEDNTLTVYIKRLREKLGDSVNIETVRGLGYRVD